jgi:poly-D-alanine transfer protein DltD
MTSPFPEHGPMLVAKVVFAVMVAPHPTEAKTGVGKKASIEPRKVKRSSKAGRTFGEALFLKSALLASRHY